VPLSVTIPATKGHELAPKIYDFSHWTFLDFTIPFPKKALATVYFSLQIALETVEICNRNLLETMGNLLETMGIHQRPWEVDGRLMGG
jgi:hypothetical protein